MVEFYSLTGILSAYFKRMIQLFFQIVLRHPCPYQAEGEHKPNIAGGSNSTAKAASFDNAEQTKTEHVNSQMDEKANPDEQGDAIQANGSTANSDSENKNLQAKSGKSITDLLFEAFEKISPAKPEDLPASTLDEDEDEEDEEEDGQSNPSEDIFACRLITGNPLKW